MKIKRNIAISDSGFIFNPDTGESFSTNAIAIELFNLLKEDKSYDKIRDEILKSYHVEQSTFEKDFQDFISVLNQYNLSEDDET